MKNRIRQCLVILIFFPVLAYATDTVSVNVGGQVIALPVPKGFQAFTEGRFFKNMDKMNSSSGIATLSALASEEDAKIINEGQAPERYCIISIIKKFAAVDVSQKNFDDARAAQRKGYKQALQKATSGSGLKELNDKASQTLKEKAALNFHFDGTPNIIIDRPNAIGFATTQDVSLRTGGKTTLSKSALLSMSVLTHNRYIIYTITTAATPADIVWLKSVAEDIARRLDK